MVDDALVSQWDAESHLYAVMSEEGYEPELVEDPARLVDVSFRRRLCLRLKDGSAEDAERRQTCQVCDHQVRRELFAKASGFGMRKALCET